MASIERRANASGDISYRVRFRLAGRNIAETFTTEYGARRFIETVDAIGGRAALDLAQARIDSRGQTTTVTDWLRQHIDGLSGITTGTRSDYSTYVNLDIATHPIGALPLAILDKGAVTAWVNFLYRERNLATKSIRNRTGLLSSALDAAIDAGLVKGNPCKGIRLPATASKDEMVFLSGEEFLTLCGFIGPDYEPLITFMYVTGMRWGEATALRVQDLDLDASPPMARVSVAWKHTNGNGRELGPPKTKRSRRAIGLPDAIVPMLRRIIAGRKAAELVFTNRQGRVVNQGTFYTSVWSPAAARMNELVGKKPRVHDLRHSHASNLLAAGVSLYIIQTRLGHESIQTTVDRYGHLANNAQSIAADAAGLALVNALPQLEG